MKAFRLIPLCLLPLLWACDDGKDLIVGNDAPAAAAAPAAPAPSEATGQAAAPAQPASPGASAPGAASTVGVVIPAQISAVPTAMTPAAAVPSQPAATPGLRIEQIQPLVQDKQIAFDSFAGNTDRNAFLSGRMTLSLCGFGRFQMTDQTYFSSNAGGGSNTVSSSGTWTIALNADGRSATLRLSIDRSSGQTEPQQSFNLAPDAAGRLLVNGRALSSSSDLATDCGQWGESLRVARDWYDNFEARLGNQQLSLDTTSTPDNLAQSQRRVELALCANGQFATAQELNYFSGIDSRQVSGQGRWRKQFDPDSGLYIELQQEGGSGQLLGTLFQFYPQTNGALAVLCPQQIENGEQFISDPQAIIHAAQACGAAAPVR